jgi:hypothetical protein
MGGRMVRGRSLSEDRVINYVNQNFVAIDINCNFGFPPNTPALAPYANFYDRHHTPGQGQGTVKYSRGFTKSLVVTPDGARILSQTPNASVTEDWRDNANYNPNGYLQFLQSGLQNWNGLTQNPIQESSSFR